MSSFLKNELDIYNFSTEIKHLPMAFDDNTLAFHLGIRNKTLWHLLKNKMEMYKCFSIPKKDKKGNILKLRHIQAPEGPMKAVHTVLNGMFTKIPLPYNVGSYVPGKSCVDTVDYHVNKEVNKYNY